MINIVGNVFLISSIFCGLLLLCFNKRNISFGLLACQVFAILACLILLLVASLNDDFSNSLVFFSSEINQPIFYKISALWSNHSGSIIFWLSLMGIVFLYYLAVSSTNKLDRDIFKKHASIVMLIFSMFIFFASNPFYEPLAGAKNGQGLNPILQDVALAIHPPILFFSYSILAVLFCQVLSYHSASEKKIIEQEIGVTIKISFAFSTLAIALGSWWAYRELGWGGYWFWDPVENLSLLPWLILLCLLHSNAKSLGRKLLSVTLALGIIAFISAIAASLIIRSGLLTSVHSFAVDAKKAPYIFAMIASFIIYPLYALHRSKQFSWQIEKINNLSFLILTQIAIIFCFYTVVLIGTIYPVIHALWFDQLIAIGESYYKNILQILLIPFIILMVISGGYKENFSKIYFTKVIIITMLFLLLAKIIYKILAMEDILNFVVLGLCVVLIFSLFAIKKPLRSMMLGHIGFGLVVFGIIVQHTLQLEEEYKLTDNTINVFDGKFIIEYEKIENISEKNYRSLKLISKISDKYKNFGNIEPEIRFYPKTENKISESHILRHYGINDIYTTIELDNNGSMILRVRYKTFMTVIWLGVIIIGLSTLVSLKTKWRKNG